MSIFELTFAHNDVEHQDADSVLGWWSLAPHDPVPKHGVAFGIPEEPVEPDTTIWRVKLPANQADAHAHMRRMEASLDVSRHESLPMAKQKLDALVAQQTNHQQRGVAFDAAFVYDYDEAEVELLNALNDIERASRAGVSFGLFDQVEETRSQFTEDVQDFLTRLLRSVTYYAWVETEIAERLCARTSVSWTSDFTTLWKHGVTREHMTLHQRSITLAIQSRDMLVQTVVLSMQGAVKLSVLLSSMSTPVGTVLALPAAWKFVNQMLRRRRESNGI